MSSKVRLYIVQALYQQEIANTDIEYLLQDHRHLQKALAQLETAQHFESVVREGVLRKAALDGEIKSYLPASWTMERLDKVLLVLLRAGLVEKLKPNMVADYVRVAHSLLDKKAAAMANAILDKMLL